MPRVEIKLAGYYEVDITYRTVVHAENEEDARKKASNQIHNGDIPFPSKIRGYYIGETPTGNQYE